ncbi:MAG: hypothetical protein ACFFDN_01130 [Candidatus Hodarchaeota archaeon]
MKDKGKSQKIFGLLIVGIILTIIGIILLINSITKRNETTVLFFSALLTSKKPVDIIPLAFIYDTLRPYFPTFVIGFIMTALGVVLIFILTIHKLPDIRDYLEEQKKSRILIIFSIISIIILIIGIISIVYITVQRNQKLAMVMVFNFMAKNTLVQILLLSNLLYPDTIAFQASILMIVFGFVGILMVIIMYKNPEFLETYEETLPEKRKPALLYKIRPEQKITISKCPACHAPLKEKPPCECDYCGTILEY